MTSYTEIITLRRKQLLTASLSLTFATTRQWSVSVRSAALTLYQVYLNGFFCVSEYGQYILTDGGQHFVQYNILSFKITAPL
jgi:hypothetical protein